jgi:hypothetical protein
MKIFFTGSPRALKTKRENHEKIYKALEKKGEHLSNLVIKADPDNFYQTEYDYVVKHYKSTIKNLKKADIVVAEVSMHSMSMGYLINKALELSKPVIALYTTSHEPFFLTGLDDPRLQIVEYNLSDVEEKVSDALDYAASQQDTRFNFFVAPKHINFMDWIAHNKKIPRSVFLRKLIEREIANDEQYNNQ